MTSIVDFHFYPKQMPWRYLGRNNAELVAYLKKSAVVRVGEIEDAMLAVDRVHFVPRGKSPYADMPQSIGFNATISAPHMHAYTMHYLLDSLKTGSRVLDVGSGSGYLTALMSHPLRNHHSSKVIGVEHIDALVDQSIENCKNIPFLKKMIEDGNLKFIKGDGFQGCEEFAPYDCISVGAVVEEVPPRLLEQLNVGGRMVIPVGPSNGSQMLTVVAKLKNEEVIFDPKFPVVYVPLTSKKNQLEDWNPKDEGV